MSLNRSADECAWGNYPRGLFEPRATHEEIMAFLERVRAAMKGPDPFGIREWSKTEK